MTGSFKGNDPMLYAPLLCFQHLCINKCPFLVISIEKQLHNMHHLTAVSTADLVTCIEHLAFWFYKYHQNSRSSVASSINPTWTWLSREICIQNNVSEKPIPINDAELRDNICRIHLISKYFVHFKGFKDRESAFKEQSNFKMKWSWHSPWHDLRRFFPFLPPVHQYLT